MLSVQKQLFPCPFSPHQSWATFPASKYKRVIVSIAFVAPRGELLLKQDKEGGFILPFERFIVGNLLLGAPARVIYKEFGIDPQSVLDMRSGHRVKVLGWQCEEGGDCDVLMTAPIARQTWLKKMFFKTYSEIISESKDYDSSIFVAAEALGWQQSELATA